MNERSERQVLMETLLNNAHIPALSIGWSKNRVSQALASGVTNITNPSPVDTQTLFQAASLSKPVSSAIVLNLIQDGLWDLDTPLADISDYGPLELREDPHYRTLTTRMVIGQCSGLGNFGGEGGDGHRFIAQPNTRFTYSGVALDFLTEVIEKKSGRSWEAIAQDFFRKVGMRSSTYQRQLPEGALHQVPRKLALAHSPADTPLPPLPDDVPGIAAGSMLTTAEDYTTFLAYCYNNEYLRSTLLTGALSTLPPTRTPETSEVLWGLGIGVYHVISPEEKMIAFHWGGNTGSISFCAIDMTTGDCVACFANADNGPSVFQAFAKPLLGDIEPLFQWLYDYCNFRDVDKQSHPQALAKTVHSLYSSEGIGDSEKQETIREQLHSDRHERRTDFGSAMPAASSLENTESKTQAELEIRPKSP